MHFSFRYRLIDMKIHNDGIEILKTVLLSFVLVSLTLWLQVNIGLNLADEGFLWYGSIQTAAGKVPLKDFQSYDPGRYYWTAAWSAVFGNGILALRLSTGIFQFIGLTFGLLAARRAVKSYWQLSIVGILLIVWMYPRHKLLDISLCMMAIFFAVRLIEDPSHIRHFVTGVFVGIAAFFGRNHGLYVLLAFFFLIVFLWFKNEKSHLGKRFFLWLAGILVGYSPMFIMFIFIPGFFDEFLKSILFLIQKGSTNLPLPVPWPWKGTFSVGILFLAVPLFYIAALASALRISKNNVRHAALFIASAFVGVFYIHYAFSRADLSHLTHSIPPFLLGTLSVPTTFLNTRRQIFFVVIVVALLSATFFSVTKVSPYYLKNFASAGSYVKYEISGDNLWIEKEQADLLDKIKTTLQQNVQPEEGLLIAPHWPMMYNVLERESPVWEIYFLFASPIDEQQKTIRVLNEKHVNWILLGDVALDGRNELRFRNTHNLIWDHFNSDFEQVASKGLPDNYQLLHRKPIGLSGASN